MTETRPASRMPRAFGICIGTPVFCGFTVSGASPAARPAVAATEAPPTVSVRDLMVGLVGHASNELWSIERDELAPKTDEDWQKLERHAMQLAASGTLTALGGTGVADSSWARRPEWSTYSQQMNAVGLAALEAARRRDLEALIAVNGSIGDVCQRCHQAMMP